MGTKDRTIGNKSLKPAWSLFYLYMNCCKHTTAARFSPAPNNFYTVIIFSRHIYQKQALNRFYMDCLMRKYDSRDNIFTPSKGIVTEIKLMSFNDLWGGDQDFYKYSAMFTFYKKLRSYLVIGLRGDTRYVDGSAPFYSYPYPDMRGLKAIQFQGEKTLQGEAELGWSFTQRWALIGFYGAGKSYNSGIKKDTDFINTGGAGIRYLIASKLGLQMGMDIAKGPYDTAVYIQFGSSWATK